MGENTSALPIQATFIGSEPDCDGTYTLNQVTSENGQEVLIEAPANLFTFEAETGEIKIKGKDSSYFE